VKSTDPLEARDGAVNVSPDRNGPLLVEGNLEIRSASGRVGERTTRAWLCRCGASANKPFCDGSHKRTGFQTAEPTP
jgi:CDGSH-type Zn-finger protein